MTTQESTRYDDLKLDVALKKQGRKASREEEKIALGRDDP